MIQFFVFGFILLFGTCKTCEKENLHHRFQEKKKIRFQIPVFEMDGFSREDRIQLSQDFANLWSKHTGYETIVLDQTSKSEFIRSGKQIPSSNFSIQSGMTAGLFHVMIVDMESGEILSFGKIPIISKEKINQKFEILIEEQLLCDH